MSTSEERWRIAREEAEEARGCCCGYWDGARIHGPHPKCSCYAAWKLRQDAKDANS